MNASTLQRNRNGHPKKWLSQFPDSGGFKRYSNPETWLPPKILGQNFLFPIFIANKRHPAKKRCGSDQSIPSLFENKGVLNYPSAAKEVSKNGAPGPQSSSIEGFSMTQTIQLLGYPQQGTFSLHWRS